MRNQVVTTGIVLARTDFQEADRIVTALTPDHGKVRLIAKGVRRPNSKLAGGIELFSLSNITYLPGRGEISTLVSSRLIRHYENIVKDITRTMLGYELLKRLNRATEDAAEEDYFKVLRVTLEGLDDLGLPNDLVELWSTMQLLKLGGHAPNLTSGSSGEKLKPENTYLFDYDTMAFKQQTKGPFTASHIKLLRLAYAVDEPSVLKQIKNAETHVADALKLVKSLLGRQVRI